MKIRTILFVLFSLFVASCNDDRRDEIDIESGQVGVAFMVTLPEPETVETPTRASYTDSDIENIDLLLFDENNKFLQRFKVEKADIENIAGVVKFTVLMDATEKNRVVHIIANGRTADGLTDRINFSSITSNMLESAAIPALQTHSLVTKIGTDVLFSNTQPLVMWSRVSLNGISIISKADNVKLLRSVACIKVKKAASGSGLSDFEIQRITLHKGADQGKVAPAAYSTAPTTTPTTANPVSISTYLDQNKAWSEMNATPYLYVYERNCNSSDYMSIIIQAKYKNVLGYYKVVMMNGSNPWNIIRNHRYNVTVTEVNGYGYTDLATAVNSAPSNALKTALTVDEQKEYPYIIADGQYYMGVTHNEAEIFGKRSTTYDIELCRVYLSRSGLTPGVTSSVAWLTNLTATSLGGNIYKITGRLNDASISGTVNATVTIKCDNMEHTLSLKWTPGISTVSDADSYVVDLVDSEKNWMIALSDPAADWLKLHPTVSTAASFPGSGFLSELSSKYYKHAYLHISKGTNRHVEVMMTCSDNNNPVTKKIHVIQ